ncbi:hypothetical protein CAPTEDRAFT_223208 [Capitella teleta]|uniref:Kringle domain-containing protein n=1 Tax=Capitella teleta TaxID=283909 RepID=R7USY4_CAPTE|nr:hypothetical protein CAPTEDRAFT_223208 [Capitella teleta]|eukprot:ELU09320.1 hypothetical protein CAPTEDRAFT_223208 [Capitella teleta]
MDTVSLLLSVLFVLFRSSEECTFRETAEHALYSHNDMIIGDVSTDECKEACLHQTVFECLSFDFISDSGTCYLSASTQSTAPGYMGSHHGASYYEKVCTNDPNPTELPEENNFTNYPEHTDKPVISEEHNNFTIIEGPDITEPEYNTSICRNTQLGKDYVGQKQITTSGNECQRWDRQYPQEHSMQGNWFSEGDLHSAVNYCRNPDGEPGGPWCYTTNPDVRWEYCEIPFCPGADFNDIYSECKKDTLGRTYRGLVSTSRSGRECQYWTRQYPHEHRMNGKGFPEGNMAAAANFCRNPDGEPEGPWCYTTDPETRWEYCVVDLC